MASDSFREDVEQALDAQTLLVQRRKREYFLSALANAARVDRPDDHERSTMIETLVRLRPSHLRLLAVLATPRDSADSADAYLQARLPGISTELMRLDWTDLQNEGMVTGYPTGVAISSYVARLTSAVTAYGRRFVDFVGAAEQAVDN